MTGGNTGIGYETSLGLAQHGAKVYIASRTESRARDAMTRIEAQLALEGKKAKLEFLHLELNSLRKAADAAEDFKKRESRLDILSTLASLSSTLYVDLIVLPFSSECWCHGRAIRAND